MMHPDTVLRTVNDAVGVGVFATRTIPRGTITWILDPLDQVLPEPLVSALEAQQRSFIHRYAWREEDDWILCWDHGRFVNHSCEANCVGVGVDFELAIRDIEAGEQLTDDYRSLGRFEDPFDCSCGSPSCERRIQPVSGAELLQRWSRSFARAMERFDVVEQPLAPWLQPQSAARLAR